MDEKILKWLYDSRSTIGEIESYFIDQPRDFKNGVLQNADKASFSIHYQTECSSVQLYSLGNNWFVNQIDGDSLSIDSKEA